METSFESVFRRLCSFFSHSDGSATRGISMPETLGAILIMALVAAGVMVGGNAITENATQTGVATYYKSTIENIQTFEKTYNALPGDLADISKLQAVSGLVAGDGDGAVSGAEEQQFWLHLQAAGLASTHFDATSTVPGTGFPAGPTPKSGYTVHHDDTIGMYLELSGYSGGASRTGVLTGSEALDLDKKYDDGKPDSGNIRAAEGSVNPTEYCIKNSEYNASGSEKDCVIRFLLRRAASTSTLESSCSSPGETRISTSESCPSNTYGRVLEACGTDNTWKTSVRSCDKARCSSNAIEGDSRRLACPAGYNPTDSVIETCSSSGVWSASSTQCNVTPNQGCATNGDTKLLACPLGQTGAVKMLCQGNVWTVAQNVCSAITCNGSNIGATRPSSQQCPTNYAGSVVEACTADGWKPVWNDCKPSYSTCSSAEAGQVKDLGCPPGQQGNYYLSCAISGKNNSNYTYSWQFKDHTCRPATCGQDAVGTVRIASGVSCPSGQPGAVTEVCNTNGNWVTRYDNCAALSCASESLGNAAWPQTTSGNTATGTCDPGYSGTITRQCRLDGTWGSVSGACTLIGLNCPELPANGAATGYASWPQTNLGQTASGTCISTYTGPVTRQCGANGAWSALTSSCTPPCAAASDNVSIGSDSYAVQWPVTAAGQVASLSCPGINTGTIQRICFNNNGTGVWQNSSNNCATMCPAQSASTSSSSPTTDPTAYSWSATYPGLTATVNCSSVFGNNYTGTVTRSCNLNTGTRSGDWGTVTSTCAPLSAYCAADGVWPQTNNGQTVSKTVGCSDMVLSVTRTCTAGVWGAVVYPWANWSAMIMQQCPTSCRSSDGLCPAESTPTKFCETDNNWQRTFAGDTASISCGAEASNSATRKCNRVNQTGMTGADAYDAVWADADFSNCFIGGGGGLGPIGAK